MHTPSRCVVRQCIRGQEKSVYLRVYGYVCYLFDAIYRTRAARSAHPFVVMIYKGDYVDTLRLTCVNTYNSDASFANSRVGNIEELRDFKKRMLINGYIPLP